MTRILLDTNVILDIALERQPFYCDAVIVFEKINDKQIQAFISATTVTDIFYILQKNSNKEKALEFLYDLIKLIDIAGIDKNTIIKALSLSWADFEDAIQAQVSLENNLDFIITRNIKDYKAIYPTTVITPSEFIKQYISSV